MNFSFPRNYPTTAQQRHRFFSPPFHPAPRPPTAGPNMLLSPHCSFRAQELRGWTTGIIFPWWQTSGVPRKPHLYSAFFLVHLNHHLSGNQSPQRVSICTGCRQLAVQAFCLLAMKAKNCAVRSESRTLDDRYDTETTSCFTVLHCTTYIKQLEMVFSHKQKAQLVRMIFWAAQSEYSTLECTQRLLKVTLIMWLSATLQQKQKMYIVTTILHI